MNSFQAVQVTTIPSILRVEVHLVRCSLSDCPTASRIQESRSQCTRERWTT